MILQVSYKDKITDLWLKLNVNFSFSWKIGKGFNVQKRTTDTISSFAVLYKQKITNAYS